jgi:hypothetical protein
MSESSKDPPLEVPPDGGCYLSEVVDLASVRIRLGRMPFKAKVCEHRSLLYSPTERRVWCEDCERTVDNFDAFLIFTRKFEEMLSEARHKMQVADEAMKSSVRRRATKQLDRAWGKMAVCYPIATAACFPKISLEARLCAREISSLPEEPRSNRTIDRQGALHRPGECLSGAGG